MWRTSMSSVAKQRLPGRYPGLGRDVSAEADARVQRSTGRRRRQQILDAAIELLSSRGYRGTGMAALAERVGITAPALLYYFGSRERLLTEVVAEADRLRETLMAEMVAEHGQVDTQFSARYVRFGDLRRTGYHNVQTATLTRLYAVLTAENLDPAEPLHGFFVERYRSNRRFVRSLLRKDQRQGIIRDDVDIDQVAAEVT